MLRVQHAAADLHNPGQKRLLFDTLRSIWYTNARLTMLASVSGMLFAQRTPGLVDLGVQGSRRPRTSSGLEVKLRRQVHRVQCVGMLFALDVAGSRGQKKTALGPLHTGSFHSFISPGRQGHTNISCSQVSKATPSFGQPSSRPYFYFPPRASFRATATLPPAHRAFLSAPFNPTLQQAHHNPGNQGHEHRRHAPDQRLVPPRELPQLIRRARRPRHDRLIL